jgi:hypothetical protein
MRLMTFVRLCDEMLLFFNIQKLFFQKTYWYCFREQNSIKKKRWNKLSDNFLIRSLSGKFYTFNLINLKMIINILLCHISSLCWFWGWMCVCVCFYELLFAVHVGWSRIGSERCFGLVLFNAFWQSFGIKTKLR